MAKRKWWKNSSDTYKLVNFYWRMHLKDFNFNLLSSGSKEHVRCLNRFERFAQIGSKDTLYRNIYFYTKVYTCVTIRKMRSISISLCL